MKILTLRAPNNDVLLNKTSPIEDSDDVSSIAKKLQNTLKELFGNGPVAGLAAPQIGIAKSVFAYSHNRTPEALAFAINPALEPIGDHQISSWEACLSCQYQDGSRQAAKISRHAKIKVSYSDIHGNSIEKILEGFGAKVFQHEFDHLQGIVNVNRSDALVKSFDNQVEFEEFMAEVRKLDAMKY